jgi:hypothetical protein
MLTVAGMAIASAQAPSGDQKPCAEPGDSSKTLSDKLDQGGGVICPPNVDPKMKAQAPETGKMPVIPRPAARAALRMCSRNKNLSPADGERPLNLFPTSGGKQIASDHVLP